jgi:squalene synthase HpnC
MPAATMTATQTTHPPAGAIAGAPPDAAAVLARASGENFPVASRVLPRATRGHLLAIYGFARLVDDIGDEAGGDRCALLDWVEGELDLAYVGEPTHPLMRRLAGSVRACRLPREPFERLIAANRQDQVTARYRDLDALLAYCRLSAAPVGELVLCVFGRATPERIARSDRVCAGLQIVEHLQDVAEDRARGRVYLPQADLQRHGCPEADLDADSASAALRAVIAIEARAARRLLAAGVGLVRELPPRPALAVAAFVAGGRAALDAIERARWDVLDGKPRPSRLGVARALARTLREALR